jgi:uncharacterized coiled-coil DUF342 family protein
MESDLIQKPVDSLHTELQELKRRTSSMKIEISNLHRQIEETVKARDALNAEVKQISNEVKELKNKRDSLNAKVRELKQKRDELRNTATEKRQMLSKLLEQARQISDQLEGNMSELSKQVKSLEWYIQTNPLAPKTERNLVARIGLLEAKLVKHKDLKNVRDKLLQLKVEVGALRIAAQTTHQELTKLAEESEKTHITMQQRVKLLTEKKKEADSKHKEFLEQSKHRHDAIAALKSAIARIEEIRSQIGVVTASTKIEKAEKLKSKYKEAAEEKLRSGQKLSFEEFQALMGDTLSDTEEE